MTLYALDTGLLLQMFFVLLGPNTAWMRGYSRSGAGEWGKRALSLRWEPTGASSCVLAVLWRCQGKSPVTDLIRGNVWACYPGFEGNEACISDSPHFASSRQWPKNNRNVNRLSTASLGNH
ncbi:hypothetical protein HDV57DRAFT_35192 [Trichoderma longibrachiatum]